MRTDIYRLVGKKCTGCGVCTNVCGKGAVVMKADRDGFMVPVTDTAVCTSCDMCVKVCPVLSEPKKSKHELELYAARANDSIRKESSSGGMFSVLAEEIFSRGGVVCGAAFDEELRLRHVVAENAGELDGLRGSKYVQSYTGSIYREVRDLLKAGRPVLFTGTPCQAAALRNFLGKDHDDLLIMDILCHGVPSQELFRKYLEQKFSGKKVVDVKFRDKRFGWTCEHILVKFDDGSEYEGNSKNDPYLRAFMRNLSLRESCGDCPFAELPHAADITVGDFWGITALDKSQNDKKGTSVVFVNTKKGSAFFNKIRDRLTVREYPNDTAMKNRIHRKVTVSQNRKRLFKFLENDRTEFEAAVGKALGCRYDIGIVSNYYALNFGGSLTQYALYNVLEDMGYSCIMIERPENALEKADINNLKKLYLEMPYDKCAVSTQRRSKQEMRNLNNHCDMFVVGSDQLFQFNLYKLLGRFVTLDWVDGHKKKVAYAASFGHSYIWGDKKELSEMAYFIRRFDAFSVREKSGVDIAKEHFGVDADWVLDPVFLCDVRHYDELISKSQRKLPKKFISSYILDPSEEKAEILKTAQKELKMNAVVFSEFGDVAEYAAPLTGKGIDVQQLSVEERLQQIKNCDFFITDSFHGTCLAIIMNKPFVSIINNKRGGSRFISLLSMFGLEDRLIDGLDSENYPLMIHKPIDFERVNKILLLERRRCISWLENALNSPKSPECSSYDVLIDKIIAQEKEIRDLKAMLTEFLNNNGALRLGSIDDPVIYFSELKRNMGNYLIVMSVKDTPGMSVIKEVSDTMLEMGLKIDIRNNHWKSYIGIIDGGNVVYEEISDKEIVFRGKAGAFDLVVASRHFKAGNVSKNIVNGTDHSVNQRGLNISVFDRRTSELVDSVCFDMHLAAYACKRK